MLAEIVIVKINHMYKTKGKNKSEKIWKARSPGNPIDTVIVRRSISLRSPCLAGLPLEPETGVKILKNSENFENFSMSYNLPTNHQLN